MSAECETQGEAGFTCPERAACLIFGYTLPRLLPTQGSRGSAPPYRPLGGTISGHRGRQSIGARKRSHVRGSHVKRRVTGRTTAGWFAQPIASAPRSARNAAPDRHSPPPPTHPSRSPSTRPGSAGWTGHCAALADAPGTPTTARPSWLVPPALGRRLARCASLATRRAYSPPTRRVVVIGKVTRQRGTIGGR